MERVGQVTRIGMREGSRQKKLRTPSENFGPGCELSTREEEEKDASSAGTRGNCPIRNTSVCLLKQTEPKCAEGRVR